MGGLFVGKASASPLGEAIDKAFLNRHQSAFTGEMVANVWREYGIPCHVTLTILGAETSMGDPKLGGRLVKYNNFGCIKYYRGIERTPWGKLINGRVKVGGKWWCTWPDPETGMKAWGLYMKYGVGGKYMRIIRSSNYGWPSRVAAIYYGRNVPGYWSYVKDLKRIQSYVLRTIRAYGYRW